MSEMLFVDAIRDEMAETTDRYTQMLGEIMTEWLRIHPEQVHAPDGKSLKGAMNALKAEARKKAQNGAYAMPPREAFDLLTAYYGMTPDSGDFGRCMTALWAGENAEVVYDVRRTPVQKKAPAVDPFNIDALLGE
jgi:hypothetical protein